MAKDAELRVEINVEPMRMFRSKLRDSMSSGPVRDMYTQWAARMRSFWRERYDKYSKGGGDWKRLEPETVKRRKAGKDGNKTASILRDTNTLYRALHPKIQQPGRYTERGPAFIIIGYGGSGIHPDAGVTIQKVAMWHQMGMGNNPTRKIIVDPDQKTRDGMIKDGNRALAKLSKQTGNQ
jgi:hypothetical protein